MHKSSTERIRIIRKLDHEVHMAIYFMDILFVLCRFK